MYEYKIGYKCANGEVIKVVGVTSRKDKALENAIKELKTYPYFYTHNYDESRLVTN